MSTEPDPWDEDPSVPTEQPGITRVAGVMWIAMGALFFVAGCLNVVVTAALQARQPNRNNFGTESCGTFLSFAIGYGLFQAGRNLVKGKAADVLTASILSILLGLLYAALGVWAIFLLPLDEVAALILGGIALLIAFGCILPALLALIGRAQYLEWRRGNRRRRRPRYEFEDERDPPGPAGPEPDGGGGDEGPKDRPWSQGRKT
jgi:hypothetical protein